MSTHADPLRLVLSRGPARGPDIQRELGDQPLRGPCHAQVLAAAILLVHLAQDEAAGVQLGVSSFSVQ